MAHGTNTLNHWYIIYNKQKFGELYCVLQGFAVNLKSHRHIYMAMLQPSLGKGCEVWNTNKCVAKALESMQFCAGKYILVCSTTTCNEPVGTDLGLKV